MLQSLRSIRESQEDFEESYLHPFASKSRASKGREIPESPCPLRTAFQRDRDRVLHCKAFRRLKHKTQVFIAPVGDHYRTRLTHTLAVSQVARTIARALRLNEDLTEAIALAHDLGHPPFGHTGERVLNEIYPPGFHHYLQSARTVETIEKLNLTLEVMDALRKDTGAEEPESLEGHVVKMADRMAYLHHDVEDAMRAGIMNEADLPPEIISVLGENREVRLNHMIIDMVQTTQQFFDKGEAKVGLSPEVDTAMLALRKWMFQHIYLNSEQQSQAEKVKRVITGLYEYFVQHPELISENTPPDASIERRAVDYIAGMTDRYAIELYTNLLLPNPYQSHQETR